jgi:hypothetical protein
MNKNFMVFHNDSEFLNRVSAGSEYCDGHGGYHGVIQVNGQATIPVEVFPTSSEAEVFAHNEIVSIAREAGSIVLPFHFAHVLQDKNAANN